MDMQHAILVCALAIGFLFGVSGLGDRPSKKQARTRRRTTKRRLR